MDFYQQVKMINYIRRCVHLNTCLGRTFIIIFDFLLNYFFMFMLIILSALCFMCFIKIWKRKWNVIFYLWFIHFIAGKIDPWHPNLLKNARETSFSSLIDVWWALHAQTKPEMKQKENKKQMIHNWLYKAFKSIIIISNQPTDKVQRLVGWNTIKTGLSSSTYAFPLKIFFS